MDTLSTQYLTSVRAAKQRYLAQTGRARQIQADLLRQIVGANRHSAFGDEHGFGEVTSHAAYARAVPMRRYHELEPWIEAEAAGKRGSLTSDHPVVFHRTSSTTGAPKKIPLTRSGALVSFANTGAHRAALLERHPEILEALDSTLALTVSRPVATTTSGGIPWCFISETDWGRLGFPRHLGAPGARTPWTPWPTDADDWQYFRLRMSLECSVRAILSWFPASLLHLATSIRERAEQLLADVWNGTVCGQPFCAPNKQLAFRLEMALAQPPAGTLRRIWPTLSVVECWTTATSRLYLEQLQTCLGDGVEVFPCGYGSTESPIAFTLDASRGTLLDVSAAFFEFVPTEANEPDATALCHELEVGKSYSLVLTTMSGLYRYAIGDVVRVLDFIDEVPIVEFQCRQGVATSLVAEKMTEPQIVSALEQLAATAGAGTFEACLCPVYATVPHYLLAVDSTATLDEQGVTRLSSLLDEQLKRNVNYSFYRLTGIVGAPRVEMLSPGTFGARRREISEAGRAVPQQKHRVVIEDAELEALRDTSRRIQAYHVH